MAMKRKAIPARTDAYHEEQASREELYLGGRRKPPHDLNL